MFIVQLIMEYMWPVLIKDRQLMDVVFTVGQYNLVSMALKTFRVPLDEGVTGIPR